MPTAKQTAKSADLDTDIVVKGVLSSIEREREREIIARRYGLYDRRETLEQIGELLGITRERVRQLEKVVITRLKTTAASGSLPMIAETEASLLESLRTHGHVMRISDLVGELGPKASKVEQARLAFLSELAPHVAVIEESDHFHNAIGTRSIHDEKKIRELVGKITDAVKKIGKPTSITAVAEALGSDDSPHVAALASISKNLAHLNGQWGLTKWPMVNPRNIRDKIYVILSERGNHMHFNEIAEAIRDSDFKRKEVTTQAIHNELIKDKRFVLIGRGIYALQEWGYKKGTVADMITEVLEEAGEPLHRDEIVKRVLKHRHVKETTILLNLQGKSQFKRVAKATYALADLA